MAQPDLQDALMEWLLDAPVSRKHFAQELERLLRRVAYKTDRFTGEARRPLNNVEATEAILQALSDEANGE